MHEKEYLEIGYVIRPHGLLGELKVKINPYCPELSELDSLFFKISSHYIPYFIENYSKNGNKFIIKFEEIDSIDEAQFLKGNIYILESQRSTLDSNVVYDELIGFEVVENGEYLGIVKEILLSGTIQHLVVINNGKEVLIPMNGPFIKFINKETQTINTQLPDGLLDI